MLDIVWVALGGFIGANARFILTNLCARGFGVTFPYGTFIINVSGSFILGLFLALAAHAIGADSFYRSLIAVGFCGGYTTFSTYTYETLTLIRENKYNLAIFNNLIGSFLVGLVAALVGYGLGQII
jgi:CrcB protein